jgi:hypothetical protein
MAGPDTTFRRAGKGPGFDGRVEPLWHAYDGAKRGMGFFERWGERSRVKGVARDVTAGIVRQKGNPGGWDRVPGERVCNLKVARMGLVRELKTWLKNATEGASEQRWPHLSVLRDRPCLIVPPEFTQPFQVLPKGAEESVPVASAAGLKRELAEVNAELRIDESFAIRKMVDFMDAKEAEIAGFEKRCGQQEGFWAKFSYVLLRKLADVSLDNRLPAFLA